jgi:excisionase family DNA binding protein
MKSHLPLQGALHLGATNEHRKRNFKGLAPTDRLATPMAPVTAAPHGASDAPALMTTETLHPDATSGPRTRKFKAVEQTDRLTTPVTPMTAVTAAPHVASEAPALMTIETFMAWVQCSRWKTYELIKSGQIRIVKIGAATRITRASAEAWLASLMVEG